MVNGLFPWWLAGFLLSLALVAWIIVDKQVSEHDRPPRWFLLTIAGFGAVPLVSLFTAPIFLLLIISSHTWTLKKIVPWLNKEV